MSAQGLREAEGGPEKIASAQELAEVRRRGRHALFAAVASTLIGPVPFVLIT
jgi:hypothetical protein